jgi:hypothetical protein
LGAAASSFCFFASGALVPVLPYLFGLQGLIAVMVAAVLVGIVLLSTGVVVGLLSGGPPVRRALRQLLIGYGALPPLICWACCSAPVWVDEGPATHPVAATRRVVGVCDTGRAVVAR